MKMFRKWFTWAVVAVIAVGVIAGVEALRSSDEQTSTPKPPHPFADIDGWIVYGNGNGIWAFDPTRPEGDLSDRIQLYDQAAKPLGWSDDGTKLLIRGSSEAEAALFLLNADGTETVLRQREHPGHLISASLCPDGSQVVYAFFGPGYESGDLRHSGIYVVETDGGGPHLLKRFGRRQSYADGPSETTVWQPTFSPDGGKIAYVDGMGDWGNGLRVMNADGSHVRVLLDSDGKLSDGIGSHFLVWSPDGSRLAFEGPGGIWVIGADGSGLRKLIPGGGNPSWSPDGSRIAYESNDGNGWEGLRIADADGSNVQQFAYGGSGPWNPLEPASELRSSDEERAASATTAATQAANGPTPSRTAQDLSVSIEVREGVANVVVRRIGADACFRVLRGGHLTIEDRAGRAVENWSLATQAPPIGSYFPAGSEKTFWVDQARAECESPGPYLATVSLGPWSARLGGLSATEACPRFVH